MIWEPLVGFSFINLKKPLRSQNTFFCMKSKNTVFLHKTIEKPYLNLHFTFHDFFPENNEDMKILSFGFFSFRT